MRWTTGKSNGLRAPFPTNNGLSSGPFPMSENAEERRVLTRKTAFGSLSGPTARARTASGKRRHGIPASDGTRAGETDGPPPSNPFPPPVGTTVVRGPAKESADAQFLRGHIVASPVSLRPAPGIPHRKVKRKQAEEVRHTCELPRPFLSFPVRPAPYRRETALRPSPPGVSTQADPSAPRTVRPHDPSLSTPRSDKKTHANGKGARPAVPVI